MTLVPAVRAFLRTTALAAGFGTLPCLLFAGAALVPAILTPVLRAQNSGQALRVVEGKVVTQDESPQPNAVVYLQDQKSLQVRTFITEDDGRYRFGQLSADVDYQLWAEFKGHKSKNRSISSFDNKKQFFFDLKIDNSK